MLEKQLPQSRVLTCQLHVRPGSGKLIHQLLPRKYSLQRNLSGFVHRNNLHPANSLFTRSNRFSTFNRCLAPLSSHFLTLSSHLPTRSSSNSSISRHLARCIAAVVHNRNNTLVLFSSLLLGFIRFSAFAGGRFSAFFSLSRTTAFFAVFGIYPPFFLQCFHHPVQIRSAKHLAFLIHLKKIELSEYPPYQIHIHIIAFGQGLQRQRSA